MAPLSQVTGREHKEVTGGEYEEATDGEHKVLACLP